MQLDDQQIETKSRFISDIVEVRRFRAILYTELLTSVALALSYLGPILLYFVIVTAILFTPYMIYVLIKERRYGWIAIFFFMVVFPYPVLYLILGDYILLPAWMLLPVIPFYLYCFLIKYSVDDWLREYSSEQQLIKQRKEWEEKKKEGLL